MRAIGSTNIGISYNFLQFFIYSSEHVATSPSSALNSIGGRGITISYTHDMILTTTVADSHNSYFKTPSTTDGTTEQQK
ncbi:hypothetical protein DOY81_011666 [Sarcophaga bullata]|nr:hypothetical protein DOY81_011666 [Sarcophaga bullata]